jgi:homopolymeric O-antigen transport system permease protein
MGSASATDAASPDSSSSLPVRIIAPSRAWTPLGLRELWEYRELLYLLVWRDVKVRYKQTALGVAWAVIQPVFTMVVFSVIFGRLAHLPSDGVPYPVFAYCALLPWQLFAFALTESSGSVVAHQGLVTKVYFPRLIMPIAAVSVGLADFLCSLVVLLGLMRFYGIVPTAAILTLPLWTAFAIAAALSVGLWLSALNVRYRDIRHAVPFLTQVWLYATPVAYALSLVPARWQTVYALNPMVGVVAGFRWAMLGRAGAPAPAVFVSAIAVLALFTGGLYYFRRTERTFADVI